MAKQKRYLTAVFSFEVVDQDDEIEVRLAVGDAVEAAADRLGVVVEVHHEDMLERGGEA